MKCIDCKYWINEKFSYRDKEYLYVIEDYIPVDVDRYDRILLGDCSKIIHNQLLDATKAYTMDGSDYTSKLKTMEDFGCIHFER